VRRNSELHHVHRWMSAVSLIHGTAEGTAEYNGTLRSITLIGNRSVRVSSVHVLPTNNDRTTQWAALGLARDVWLLVGYGTDDDSLTVDVLNAVHRWIGGTRSDCRDSFCFRFLVTVTAMEEFSFLLAVVVVLLVLLIVLVDLVLDACLDFIASDVTDHIANTVAYEVCDDAGCDVAEDVRDTGTHRVTRCIASNALANDIAGDLTLQLTFLSSFLVFDGLL